MGTPHGSLEASVGRTPKPSGREAGRGLGARGQGHCPGQGWGGASATPQRYEVIVFQGKRDLGAGSELVTLWPV